MRVIAEARKRFTADDNGYNSTTDFNTNVNKLVEIGVNDRISVLHVMCCTVCTEASAIASTVTWC